MRPVFHPLYYDYRVHIYVADKSERGGHRERRGCRMRPYCQLWLDMLVTSWLLLQTTRYTRIHDHRVEQFTESQADRYRDPNEANESSLIAPCFYRNRKLQVIFDRSQL